MKPIKTSCACGEVQGTIEEGSKRKGGRLICYCKDCQAFAHFLEKGSEVLNEHGGTEVYQIAPAQLKIKQGAENLRCVRLSPKGLFRWYTACCNTPVGNTISAKVPFVGVVHNFIAKTEDQDETLGPVIMSIQAKDAKGKPSGNNVHQAAPLSLLATTLVKLAYRAITGQAQPNPFFSGDGEPVHSPMILSKQQRTEYSNQ